MVSPNVWSGKDPSWGLLQLQAIVKHFDNSSLLRSLSWMASFPVLLPCLNSFLGTGQLQSSPIFSSSRFLGFGVKCFGEVFMSCIFGLCYLLWLMPVCLYWLK